MTDSEASSILATVDQFARVVLGYHGNADGLITELLDGTRKVADWPVSDNSYDWLGKGIYFWEHAPKRALRWAEDAIEKRPARYPNGAKPAVIGAVIQLSPCFDLTEVASTDLLAEAFKELEGVFVDQEKELPVNRGKDQRLRDRDCLVINYCLDVLDKDRRFKTVRCAFEEGPEAFPGAAIRKESHIQIAVRDPSCILGVFRPNL